MNFLTNSAVNLEFNPMAFVKNLKYMGVGMLVIFVVIGIIILSTKLVKYLFSEKIKTEYAAFCISVNEEYNAKNKDYMHNRSFQCQRTDLNANVSCRYECGPVEFFPRLSR